MKILVVASQRPWEVTEPLKRTEAEIEIVQINPEKGIIRRLYDSLSCIHSSVSEFDPDVILLDVYDVPGTAALVVAKSHDVPIVARVVGDRIGKLKDDRIQTQKERGNYSTVAIFTLMYSLSVPIFNLSDGLMVVSKELKRKMEAQTRLSEDNIEVVPIPFRNDQFDVADKTVSSESDEEYITVLTVTNLEYRGKFEGVCDTLNGMKQLFEERNDVQYRIAGNGAYYEDLQTFIDETFNQESQRQVDLLGFVDDIKQEYRNADIFLYISYLEGYPNAVLEAQGMQLPVVTNRAEGMKDQVDHFSTGVFIDPKNSFEIRDTIAHLSDCAMHRASLGQKARETALRRNSDEEIGKTMVVALERLLTNR